MEIKNVSIIIPTFKRERQINKILNSLKNQHKNNYQLEIIICDSFSGYIEKNFPEENDNFKIKYFNIEENVLSSKRNYGIKKTFFENIILIDDDCIPDENFLETYHKDFYEIDDKTIISGIVDYPEEYILKYNHIKYKDSRHFKISKEISKNDLNPDKIVAMNMGFKNSSKTKILGYFNEKFIGYGFEDYEFACRYKEHGFKLKKTKARIIHDEGKPEFDKYLTKYYHLGRDGMKNLISINELYAKNTIYFKLETNFFFKFIIKIPKFIYLLMFLEKLILKTDKYKYMYFSGLYSFARLLSYMRGFIDRNKNKSKSKNENWYE
tara:strand:+ start:346 stop:1314 length:969 start_codon:yes stop_codon:yes gene_type:complete